LAIAIPSRWRSRISSLTKADIDKRRADRWNFLFIAGMWFQNLFNYD
jgi:hypothetical protein